MVMMIVKNSGFNILLSCGTVSFIHSSFLRALSPLTSSDVCGDRVDSGQLEAVLALALWRWRSQRGEARRGLGLRSGSGPRRSSHFLSCAQSRCYLLLVSEPSASPGTQLSLWGVQMLLSAPWCMCALSTGRSHLLYWTGASSMCRPTLSASPGSFADSSTPSVKQPLLYVSVFMILVEERAEERLPGPLRQATIYLQCHWSLGGPPTEIRKSERAVLEGVTSFSWSPPGRPELAPAPVRGLCFALTSLWVLSQRHSLAGFAPTPCFPPALRLQSHGAAGLELG